MLYTGYTISILCHVGSDYTCGCRLTLSIIAANAILFTQLFAVVFLNELVLSTEKVMYDLLFIHWSVYQGESLPLTRSYKCRQLYKQQPSLTLLDLHYTFHYAAKLAMFLFAPLHILWAL